MTDICPTSHMKKIQCKKKLHWISELSTFSAVQIILLNLSDTSVNMKVELGGFS